MVLPTYPRMAPLHGGSSAGKSDLCCGRLLNVVGRPGLHQSGLMLTCFADCPSPGPRKNDLTIYWALGPFVRSFILLVDPGDICPHSQRFGRSRVARAAPEPLHGARGRSRSVSTFIICPFVAFSQGGRGKAPCCPRRAPNMVSPVSC
jgi:hypothetical protein